MGIQLINALFTKTQQRVLAIFFGDPDRTFIKQDVIERARCGSGAVQRELARLVESGILEVLEIGRQKHYRANPLCDIYMELRRIIEKTSIERKPAAPRIPIRKRPARPAPSREERVARESPPQSDWQLIFD